jgi:hypothetical protein
MSTLSKVFVGIVALLSVLFMVMAARSLVAHQAWRTAEARANQAIEQAESEQKRLMDGAQPGEGLRDLKVKLRDQANWRGRVWTNCQVGTWNQETGGVTLTMEAPVPASVDANRILFAFDDRPVAEGGGYVGMFKVTGKADTTLDLVPAFKPVGDDLKRMQAHAGPWTLHEQMPKDTHQVFAGLTEDDLKGQLPDSSEQEFLRDGQPAAEADPAERVVDGNYVRKLRDYEVLMRDYDRARILRLDQIAAAEADLKALARAQAGANEQIAFHEQEIKDTTAHLAQVSKERDAVAAHRAALEKQLGETVAKIDELLALNRQLLADLATRQHGALQAASAAN